MAIMKYVLEITPKGQPYLPQDNDITNVPGAFQDNSHIERTDIKEVGTYGCTTDGRTKENVDIVLCLITTYEETHIKHACFKHKHVFF